MKLFKRLFGAFVTIAIVGGVLFAWTQRQDIYDWYRLRDYKPPQQVVLLADHTTMTSGARRVFYVNRPVIAHASEFNDACSLEASIVLGCYIPGKGIYLYDVEDPRLSGVKEVTAAHEMLHAAYERLSPDEKQHIDDLTQAAYANVTSERVRANVDTYRESDPNVVPNELHSILATEINDLPPELEAYYQRYFTNRKAIVAFSEQYESEFTSRQQQVASYDGQLSNLKISIEANKNELQVQYGSLESEKNRLDGLLAGGQVVQYNQSVPAFNAQVNRYNATVRETDKMINDYNAMVEKRNSIAIEVKNLAEAIDSRPQSF